MTFRLQNGSGYFDWSSPLICLWSLTHLWCQLHFQLPGQVLPLELCVLSNVRGDHSLYLLSLEQQAETKVIHSKLKCTNKQRSVGKDLLRTYRRASYSFSSKYLKTICNKSCKIQRIWLNIRLLWMRITERGNNLSERCFFFGLQWSKDSSVTICSFCECFIT